MFVGREVAIFAPFLAGFGGRAALGVVLARLATVAGLEARRVVARRQQVSRCV